MAVEVRDREAAVGRAGGAATLGGALAALASLALWLRPGSTLALGALVLGACLTVLGVPGLALRATGRGRPLAFSALVLGFSGLAAALLGIALVALAAVGGGVGDLASSGVPFAATAGAVGVAGAAFFAGLTVLWTGLTTRLAGVVLTAGALLLVGFDTGGTQALLALPLGVGWVAVGIGLTAGVRSVEQDEEVPDEDE
jgi:hypothetical protein